MHIVKELDDMPITLRQDRSKPADTEHSLPSRRILLMGSSSDHGLFIHEISIASSRFKQIE